METEIDIPKGSAYDGGMHFSCVPNSVCGAMASGTVAKSYGLDGTWVDAGRGREFSASFEGHRITSADTLIDAPTLDQRPSNVWYCELCASITVENLDYAAHSTLRNCQSLGR